MLITYVCVVVAFGPQAETVVAATVQRGRTNTAQAAEAHAPPSCASASDTTAKSNANTAKTTGKTARPSNKGTPARQANKFKFTNTETADATAQGELTTGIGQQLPADYSAGSEVADSSAFQLGAVPGTPERSDGISNVDLDQATLASTTTTGNSKDDDWPTWIKCPGAGCNNLIHCGFPCPNCGTQCPTPGCGRFLSPGWERLSCVSRC